MKQLVLGAANQAGGKVASTVVGWVLGSNGSGDAAALAQISAELTQIEQTLQEIEAQLSVIESEIRPRRASSRAMPCNRM